MPSEYQGPAGADHLGPEVLVAQSTEGGRPSVLVACARHADEPGGSSGGGAFAEPGFGSQKHAEIGGSLATAGVCLAVALAHLDELGGVDAPQAIGATLQSQCVAIDDPPDAGNALELSIVFWRRSRTGTCGRVDRCGGSRRGRVCLRQRRSHVGHRRLA